MTKVLICTFSTPGYAANNLSDYLTSIGCDVEEVVCPAKHERRFIPGVSHVQNVMQVLASATGSYDVAIAPDPSFMAGLNRLLKLGQVKKTIYWRLDYWPQKYPGPFNHFYQWLENFALKSADEIWSIADPTLPKVAASLERHLSKVRYVPYLMPTVREVPAIYRQPKGLWMGPDLDGSRDLCLEAAKSVGLEVVVADYTNDKLRLSPEALVYQLDKATVGLAVYKPYSKSPKYFCDSSRIRTLLNHGVPVVTSNVAPTHKTVCDFGAGWVTEHWNTDEIKYGIEHSLAHFEQLSEAAYAAAKQFTFSEWEANHGPLV